MVRTCMAQRYGSEDTPAMSMRRIVMPEEAAVSNGLAVQIHARGSERQGKDRAPAARNSFSENSG